MNHHLSAFLSRHLIDRSGGHRRAVLRKYRGDLEIDQMARDNIEQYQNRMLAELLNASIHSVPHVRESVQSKASIGETDARDVLGLLPPMRRVDLQERPAHYSSERHKAVMVDATGGSTGTPMRFGVDRSTQIAREASQMWSNHLAGWRYGCRVAMLWGAPQDMESPAEKWRQHLRWKIDNIRWFNAFSMGEQEMRRFHSDLTSFQPHVIVAYAGAIHEYARFLEEEGLEPRYPLTSIVSSAEVLTDRMRADVERVFQKPVFNRYGNRETGAIAAECSMHHGLHIHVSDFIVEVESDNPRKIPGPILITYLRNFCMPLLRYDTGDLGLIDDSGQCTCGRSSVRLTKITGRRSNTIRTRHGDLVHGEYFTHLFYDVPEVRSFQFIQESLDTYTVKMVARPADMTSRESGLKQAIAEVVGDDADVSFEYVDEIPKTASGKYLFTISKLSHDT